MSINNPHKRPELFVNAETEEKIIKTLPRRILAEFSDLTPQNTLVLMVSPDYSATLAMHVAHALSKDGEMCDILPIHVPFPDDKNIERWVTKAEQDLKSFHAFENKLYKNYLLVESGVIRGGTYTWLTNLLINEYSGRIITTTAYENIHSDFKSDIVLEYYNDEEEELTFYFERYNKHWL